MTKIFVLLVLIYMMLSCYQNGKINRVSPISLAELSNDLTYFYESPSQDKFSRICNEIPYHKDELVQAGGSYMIPIFYGIAKRTYNFTDDRIDTNFEWFKNMDKVDFDAELIDSKNPTPEQNDGIWMAFFASGQDKYLDELFRRAMLNNSESNILDMALSSAAWSYKANCKQHKKVLEHLMKQVTSEYVKSCLNWANSRQ